MVWTDGSTQAISQREANLVLDTIRKRARRAWTANAPTDSSLVLTYAGVPPESTSYYFWLSGSRLYCGYDPGNTSAGPLIQSAVESFKVSYIDNLKLVRVITLRLVTAQGERVSTQTNVHLMNGS
jgi:hypothetical protein